MSIYPNNTPSGSVPSDLMEHRLISKGELAALLSLSACTVDRKVRESRAGESDFPLPLDDVGRRPRWRAKDAVAWIARRSTKSTASAEVRHG